MLDDSPPFYNGIKSRAFAISPPLVEDEQLFQSIVLAVAGHRKHLLVRTAEENVHSVLKLTVNVSSNITSCASVRSYQLAARMLIGGDKDCFIPFLVLIARYHRYNRCHFRNGEPRRSTNFFIPTRIWSDQ